MAIFIFNFYCHCTPSFLCMVLIFYVVFIWYFYYLLHALDWQLYPVVSSWQPTVGHSRHTGQPLACVVELLNIARIVKHEHIGYGTQTILDVNWTNHDQMFMSFQQVSQLEIRTELGSTRCLLHAIQTHEMIHEPTWNHSTLGDRSDKHYFNNWFERGFYVHARWMNG